MDLTTFLVHLLREGHIYALPPLNPAAHIPGSQQRERRPKIGVGHEAPGFPGRMLESHCGVRAVLHGRVERGDEGRCGWPMDRPIRQHGAEQTGMVIVNERSHDLASDRLPETSKACRSEEEPWRPTLPSVVRAAKHLAASEHRSGGCSRTGPASVTTEVKPPSRGEAILGSVDRCLPLTEDLYAAEIRKPFGLHVPSESGVYLAIWAEPGERSRRRGFCVHPCTEADQFRRGGDDGEAPRFVNE